MTTETGRARVADDPDALARLDELLTAYPDLPPSTTQEVGILLKGLGPLDTGLLSANAAAWAKAERFRSDHPAIFRASWKLRLLWFALTIAFILFVVLLWDVALD
ncbi:hypothetical protein [Sphingomonas swuensis]